jgi:hypothetical protein
MLVAWCLPAGTAYGALVGSGGLPQWVVSSVAQPTRFTPGVGQVYVVTVTNVGGEETSGPVDITDALPTSGAIVLAAYGSGQYDELEAGEAFTGGAVECPSSPPSPGSPIECTYDGTVAPGDSLTVIVEVEVTASVGQEVGSNVVSVSGGGAVSAQSAAPPTDVVGVEESARTSFGVANVTTATASPQAGAHPNFTTSFALNTKAPGIPISDPRDVEVTLPPGFIGNPMATPRCTAGAVQAILPCPASTAVGVATTRIRGGGTYVSLIYNIVPYPGEPAAFAFQLGSRIASARLDARVAPDPGIAGRYAVRVSVPEINESEPVISSSVTLWGVPSEFNGPGPDQAEGYTEDKEEHGHIVSSAHVVTFGDPGESYGTLADAFMRNPTSCIGGPSAVGFEVDSWQEPGNFEVPAVPGALPMTAGEFTGCGLLSALFAPSLKMHPDGATLISPGIYQAGAPTGYDVDLGLPQSGTMEHLATPDLKDATVALPVGVVASPAVANGLEVCSEAQLAPDSLAKATCPSQSQIGSVEIESPLLEEPLVGEVFLGAPACGLGDVCGPREAAAGNMVRLFLQLQYGGESRAEQYLRVKLIGRTEIDQTTGQLTSVFEDNPQLPFSELRLHLEGGPKAALAEASECGAAAATARFTPWSGNASVASAAPGFVVGGCSSGVFSPSFNAGMSSSARAGAYSPFEVTLSRADQDQDFSGITVRTPPGLAGMVSHVTQCGEAQADAGTCPSSSEIGSVTAAVGPGQDPYWVTGGKAFLTGPYHGAPFGLSIVVPAVAGPFTLAGQTGTGEEGDGNVVVRASVAVNALTTALTITSNPLPQALDGIPLQVKTINVNVDRPEFMFNATNCESMQISATVESALGKAADLTAPYQASDCAALGFAPSFAVSTHSYHSRKAGAYLKVAIGYVKGQANIKKVHVTLPKRLPSRLSTLKMACTEAQFASNPAGCPSGSFVGTATASTPVLTKVLTGPAVFVSHAGAAFPSLDFVLQGEGVTVIVEGSTFITKAGITNTTFSTVPDVPVNHFQVILPEGPHSALAGTGNLCKGALYMPTVMTGQNGAVVEKTRTIKVGGCGKGATSRKAHAKRRKGADRRHKAQVRR